MASGKGANIAKCTILLLLWGSPHFGSFRRPEIPKIHGAWKWDDDFAAFGVPLILAAFGGRKSRKSKGPWKWLPEKERTLGNGRFCCFCGVPLISAAFGGRKSRKSKGPWKWLPEKERTLRNERFCCSPHFCSSAAGNPETPRGLEMGRRICCFCGVHLISAVFGGRKSRKSKGPWKWLPEKERKLRN